MNIDEETRVHMLHRYYKEVHSTLLCYQSHTLGLFPRGKSGHARVRDNVYCASALWSLSLAYRHIGDDKGRTHELEQSAVKCMRGILFCYMRQTTKVEHFKRTQSWEDALHSRFDSHTGDPVVDHQEWGHLQIDGTSLFLLMLAQMTAADVQVIYTMDEVDFVQNLVYYVERAYRIPDYGMWERGSRDNVGRRELHASSIGMAKAALQAMNGLNLFGSQGSSLSIIHVDPDAQYRNYVILNNLLPRESSSKETDASLLLIAGYPAFAIDDATLCKDTEDRTKQLLGPEGKHGTTYGFKRFARDGHHTVKEDRSKKYYNPEELTQYEGIECEWPLFYLIVIITEYCQGNKEVVEKYWKKLEKCLLLQHSEAPDVEDWLMVPRLYYVCESELCDEATTLGSAVTMRELKMEPLEEDTPFLWAQSLYLIARLTRDSLLTVNDVDPLGLRLPHHARHAGKARHLGFKAPGHDTIIQVSLIAETTRLQAILATHGIPTQTQKQVEPIKIRPPGDVLMKVFQNIGANKKLGLTGRPSRPIGALGTSKIYRILGQMVVFFPTDSNVDFYISFDVMMLIDLFTSTMSFLNLHWNMSGKPTMCIYLTENRLKGANFRKFINFLAQVKHGIVNGVKVHLNSLQALIPTSYVENLEVAMDEETDKSLQKKLHTPPRRTPSAALMSTSSSASLGSHGGGDDYDVFMVDNTEIEQLSESDPMVEVEPEFSQADLKGYTTEKLLDTLSKIAQVNRLGRLYVLHELKSRNEQGRFDTDEMIEETLESIYEEAGEKKHWKTVRLAAALLGKVVDSLAPALTSLLVRGKEVSLGVFGYPELTITEPMSPKEIVKVVYEKCMPYDPVQAVLQQEILIYLGEFITRQYHSAFSGMLRIRIGWIIHAVKNEHSRMSSSGSRSLQQLAPSEVKELLLQVLLDDDTRNPLSQRKLDGALNRVPKDFYVKVFGILQRVRGGVIVRDKQLPQQPTIHELDAHEKTFALKVEELLSNITFPEYRQIAVELLMVVSTVLERNPEVKINGSINLDELLQDAMYIHSEDCRKEIESTDSTTDSANICYRSDSFYALYPDGLHGSASYIARAVVNKVLQEGLQYDPSKACSIS